MKKSQSKDNIIIVDDGQEVLDYVYHQGKFKDKDKHPVPNLILLDINLPRVTGFEVLKKIKEDKAFSIPIIMMTSSQSEEDINSSYEYGACGYIPKPVNYDDSLKIIEGFNFYWHVINRLPKVF